MSENKINLPPNIAPLFHHEKFDYWVKVTDSGYMCFRRADRHGRMGALINVFIYKGVGLKDSLEKIVIGKWSVGGEIVTVKDCVSYIYLSWYAPFITSEEIRGFVNSLPGVAYDPFHVIDDGVHIVYYFPINQVIDLILKLNLVEDKEAVTFKVEENLLKR